MTESEHDIQRVLSTMDRLTENYFNIGITK